MLMNNIDIGDARTTQTFTKPDQYQIMGIISLDAKWTHQSVSQLEEMSLSHAFGKDISQLLMCATLPQFFLSFFHHIWNAMILEIKVFRLSMMDEIFLQLYGTQTITKDRSRIILFPTYFVQHLSNLHGLYSS